MKKNKKLKNKIFEKNWVYKDENYEYHVYKKCVYNTKSVYTYTILDVVVNLGKKILKKNFWAKMPRFKNF